MGPKFQPNFINAVIKIETMLTPQKLLEELKYLANASMTGTIIQAVAFKIIAFMEEGYLLIEVF